jgi:hypothetical protein
MKSINCEFFITFKVNATFLYHTSFLLFLIAISIWKVLIEAPANSFRVYFGISTIEIYWCALTKNRRDILINYHIRKKRYWATILYYTLDYDTFTLYRNSTKYIIFVAPAEFSSTKALNEILGASSGRSGDFTVRIGQYKRERNLLAY